MDSFMTEDELNQHKVDAHTRTECPHCNKMIIVSYLATHIRLRHEQDKRVVCDLCGRISNNKHGKLVDEKKGKGIYGNNFLLNYGLYQKFGFYLSVKFLT